MNRLKDHPIVGKIINEMILTEKRKKAKIKEAEKLKNLGNESGNEKVTVLINPEIQDIVKKIDDKK